MWFSLHSHSEYSVLDGMASVKDMVATAVANGYPALGLTDHGVMSGSLALYRECKRQGIPAFPGVEAYVVSDCSDHNASRYHLTMVALTYEGYEGLLKLSSRSHQRDRYHRKPRVDYDDLAVFSDRYGRDVFVASGCFFGQATQTLVSLGDIAAKQVIRTLGRWFPHFCVEIQHHGTQHQRMNDNEIADALWGIAVELGIPVIVTQDAHYCDESSKRTHDFMKSIAYHGSDPSEVQFPGDAYHLAPSDWVESHYDWPTGRKIWTESLRSCTELLDAHELRMPALDSYSFHVPVTVSDPMRSLRTRCANALLDKCTDDPKFTASLSRYDRRLREEYEVIEATGFASYFLLVRDIVQWCRERGILVNARGSANGSLVCWLLGITGVDPVRWKLLFERFLTMDRSKPPDIDLDIEDVRREEVAAHLRKRYGAVQIGTFSRTGIDDAGQGSLWRMFLTYARQNGVGPGDLRELESIETLRRLDPEMAENLEALAAQSLRRSAGAHAAGFVLPTSAHPIDAYLATMLIASSNSTVTQMEMHDVEEAGYVKIDALGLRSLTTLRTANQLLGREPLDLDWIPLDDSKTFTMIRNGKTVGVFQLEGWTAKRGVKELGVRSIKDVILVMALYRTATIASGYTAKFLRRRNKEEPASYVCDEFEAHTRDTYGIMVFQEQVIEAMRDLGVSIEQLNRVLKAVKNTRGSGVQMLEERKEIVRLCKDHHGMSDNQAAAVWEAIEGFSAYGFNRSHATAYGLMAYRMAYIKRHHPLEFMTAVLATSVGSPRESVYVAEARTLKLKVLPVDVNCSGVHWTMDKRKGGIRKGLLSIKGVGGGAAQELVDHAPYADMDDLLLRVAPRIVTGGKSWNKDKTLNGVLGKLQQANALKSLGVVKDPSLSASTSE